LNQTRGLDTNRLCVLVDRAFVVADFALDKLVILRRHLGGSSFMRHVLIATQDGFQERMTDLHDPSLQARRTRDHRHRIDHVTTQLGQLLTHLVIDEIALEVIRASNLLQLGIVILGRSCNLFGELHP
jgi:hypothetical protein